MAQYQCKDCGMGVHPGPCAELPETPNLSYVKEIIKGIIPDDPISHPKHYGGDTPYEVIKVAEAWGLDKDAYLFNALKYIGRSGKKDNNPVDQDLEKAVFYINRRIETIRNERS